MEIKTNSINDIVFYFKENGILIYGEYMLINKENDEIFVNQLLNNYYNFLKNDNNICSKINHKICYFFCKKKYKKEDNNNKIVYCLSKLDNDLSINYYNFFLICNLIHYYNSFHLNNDKETIFLLFYLKKFSNLILNNNSNFYDNKHKNNCKENNHKINVYEKNNINNIIKNNNNIIINNEK